MKRLLAYWVVLATAMTIGTLVGSFLLFRHIDLTFEAFSILVVIPPFQALVMTWATATPYADRPRRVWAGLVAHPLAVPVLIVDSALLPIGLFLRDWSVVGPGGASSLHTPWLATKLALAGLCLLVSAVRLAGHRAPDSHGPRLVEGAPPRIVDGMGWLLAFGVALLAVGIHPWFPWLPRIESALAGAVTERQPLIFARLELNLAVFVTFLVLSLKTGAAIVRRTPWIARAWDAAMALCMVGALSVALNTFLSAQLLDPYRFVWLTSSSAAATVFLLCALAEDQHP